MTRGDKKRAEKYVAKMDKEVTSDSDVQTVDEPTPAEVLPETVVAEALSVVEEATTVDKSMTEGGSMLKVFIGTVVIGIAIAMASILLGSDKEDVIEVAPASSFSIPKAGKKGFLERFSGR